MSMPSTPPFSEIFTSWEPLFFIAGPCVIESEELCFTIANALAQAAQKHSITIIFKASYDKANRTSVTSFRGMGMHEGLAILDKIRAKTGLPIITDIHTAHEAEAAGQVVDIIQIPAFLCRQTDLLVAAGQTGKIVNIKKGQFAAPADMRFALDKTDAPCMLTERGTFFGYNRLVVDYPGMIEMQALGVPVIFDATHSVQKPGGGSGCSSGDRTLAIPLARAAAAIGVDGLFFEVHPNPESALCDRDNTVALDSFIQELPRLLALKHQVL